MPINRTVYTKQVAPAGNQTQAIAISAAELLNARELRLMNLEASYTGAATGDAIRVQVLRTPSNNVLATFQQPGTTATGGSLVRHFVDGMRFSLAGTTDTGYSISSQVLVSSSGAAGGTVRSHNVNCSYVLD